MNTCEVGSERIDHWTIAEQFYSRKCNYTVGKANHRIYAVSKAGD